MLSVWYLVSSVELLALVFSVQVLMFSVKCFVFSVDVDVEGGGGSDSGAHPKHRLFQGPTLTKVGGVPVARLKCSGSSRSPARQDFEVRPLSVNSTASRGSEGS